MPSLLELRKNPPSSSWTGLSVRLTRELLALTVEAVEPVGTIGALETEDFLVAEAKLAGKIVRADGLGSA